MATEIVSTASLITLLVLKTHAHAYVVHGNVYTLCGYVHNTHTNNVYLPSIPCYLRQWNDVNIEGDYEISRSVLRCVCVCTCL